MYGRKAKEASRNAAGKTVTVTNVLGQTVAKTVVSGNNASISLCPRA
ncbi:MAG: DUF6383 domain-containing protein [Tannerellaceae bacterium]|nr:DUF6383 domain-containing protein [Tannerellaceae bacterium]